MNCDKHKLANVASRSENGHLFINYAGGCLVQLTMICANDADVIRVTAVGGILSVSTEVKSLFISVAFYIGIGNISTAFTKHVVNMICVFMWQSQMAADYLGFFITKVTSSGTYFTDGSPRTK